MKMDKFTILILDDSEIVRDVLYNKVISLGYTVMCASTAQEAFEIKNKNSIDLFLLDINLPGMDGIEFLKQLDIQNNIYTAIMLSAVKDIHVLKFAMELGAFSYIGKPFDYTDLEIQITRALQLVKLKKEKENNYRILQEEVSKKSDELNQYVAILENREKRLDTIIKSIGDALIALDNEDSIMLVNLEFERIANQKLSHFIGENIDSVMENSELLKQLKCLMEKDSSLQYQQDKIISLTMNDKVHYYRSTISTIKDDEMNTIGLIITLRDQSEKIRIEQLRRSFLNSVSHELRTPATAIISMTEALHNTEIDDEQKEYLNIISDCENTLLDLINDILDYSRIERGVLTLQLGEFCLGTLFEKSAKMVACKAKEKGLQFKIIIDPKVYCKIMIDKARFTQVLLNLIGNAIKFTLQGEIEVVIDMLTKTEDKLEIMCSIRDSGIGIERDKIPIIFEEFIQVDGASNRKYSGIGLGLTIAKEITDLMKGKIWLESEVGKGSTFYFSCSFDLVKDKKLSSIF